MASIKEMDQTNWVCYKFGENSYYYGEVGLLDHSGIVHPKDNAQLAADPKVKLVKNGFGIYIYDDPTGQSRYEGQWAKDQKNGKGILHFKDGTIYEGQFKDGSYHDNGKLQWKNGDVYDGRWKKGRMDGPGIFKRHDGLSLKGSFKNNYFIDQGNVLRNPYMSDKEYNDLKKRRKQIVKQYEKNQKVKNGFFQRISVQQKNKISELIQKSNKNNRVPLLISSQQSNFCLAQALGVIKKQDQETYQIDLRKSYKSEGEDKYNYIKQIQKITQNSMKNGGILILSLDDSQTIPQFEQLFYPQIKQLYTSNGFNSSIWAPQDLKKYEIKSKIIGDSNVNEKFNFGVWSKVKYSQQIKNDLIRQKLQKRFQSVLPFIKIDIIFVENGKKQQPTV